MAHPDLVSVVIPAYNEAAAIADVVRALAASAPWREVIAYDDYIANKGEQGAKEVGKLRLEGKEYIVREGDVMHFRFNV